MNKQHWAEAYIGRPYVEGAHDCADFAVAVLRERFGREIALPAHGTLDSAPATLQARATGTREWDRQIAALQGDYGNGNGSTTFTLPNFSSRFPLARGSGRDRGDTGGAATHRLSVAEMPAHAHDLGGTRTDAAGTDRNKHTGASGAVTTVAANNAYGVKNTGGGAAHNNMPPYLVINFMIKW